MDWFKERAAFYGSGVPTFERLTREGVDPVRAEAEAIIAEYEALYGKLPTKQHEDGVNAAIATIQKRNRGY